jgi:23S rRNA (cytosine1962-C5)-methyltransferase
MNAIYLKPGKEKALLRRHPWVFSGAVGRRDGEIADGDMVAVRGHDGRILGYGYYNRKTQIAVRILSFGDRAPDAGLLRGLAAAAAARRSSSPLLHDTDSYRLVFSEGDFLPGLIVDAYGPHLVLQCLTLGMERLKDSIVGILADLMKPESIYERSEHEGRGLEGLTPAAGQLYGNTPDEVTVRERGLAFPVSVREGQKTGFYLDQRENRSLVRVLAEGRDVLNLFCYTGAFSAAAGAGGARRVVSVDASGDALETAKRAMAANCPGTPAGFVRADVFRYLRDNPVESDFIIMDPPALATSRQAVQGACRGYKDLHLQVAAKCPPGSIILTCSCSRFIGMDLFQMVVFEAFADAGRNAAIIGKYGHPCDHPVSIFCPETEYLKALLLRVE